MHSARKRRRWIMRYAAWVRDFRDMMQDVTHKTVIDNRNGRILPIMLTPDAIFYRTV